MAHELDFSTGDAAFVELGDKVTAWHQKGRTIDPETFEGLTGDEKIDKILEAGRLDWTVDPYDLIDETGQRIPDWAAYKRSDNDEVMTVAPTSYTILQNHELLELIEPLLNEGIFQFETAGALREGQDVWSMFRFNPKDPYVAEFFRNEGIIPFALLANNHSRSRTVEISETPIRVVCANTLGMARRAASVRSVKLRHTRNVKSMSVEAVEDLWGQITSRYAAVATSYASMKQRFLEQEEFERHVLDGLAPFPTDEESQLYEHTLEKAVERRALVQRLWDGDGAGIEGDHSAWEAYQAVTEAVDHHEDQFPVRTSRLRGIFPGGSLDQKKQRALDSLYELSVAV